MAYTAQAKNKIRAYFNKIDKEDNLKRGEELLNKELRKKKISSSEFYKDENLDKIFDELHVVDLTELYINIGNGKFSPISIINILNDNEISKEELIMNKVNSNAETVIHVKNDIIVEGIDEIKVNIASCCKPIPGDMIVGYITKGNGISIHRSVCPNISELDERLIDVRWNEIIDKKYSTNILVHTLKVKDPNKNILIDIIAKTSSSDIVIQNINMINTSDDNMIDINLLVPNKEKLLKFINDIEMLEDVINVERLIK